jgi:1-acyl-sn-glycerol-3-phosphate acyltransferase
MFPEGTRRAKGMRKRHEARWHTGAARIALEAAVPLVPAGIAGTNRLKRFGPLRVAYGPPVDTADLAGMDVAAASRIATDRLREAITTLERSLGSTPSAEPAPE